LKKRLIGTVVFLAVLSMGGGAVASPVTITSTPNGDPSPTNPPVPIPEPATLLLTGVGAALLARKFRRRKH
jgi:hypothetical protein